MTASAQSSQTQDAQTHKRGFKEMGWLRAGLGMGSALLVQDLAGQWGQHLSPAELYPLALAVGMSFYNLHLFNPIPPTDHRSRLRALWLPQQKKQALGLSFLLILASVYFFNHRQSRMINELTLDEIKALKPIDRGLYTISGTPQTEENPYRWVFSENLEPEEAPYLIPLQEFKGQVLVVSKSQFSEPLTKHVGLVSELSSFARPHYVAYRNYMGISPNAPIYLFDIRGIWWFDPQAIAAIIMSVLLFMGILGSATRDPNNESRLMYIPPELRTDPNMSADEHTDDEQAQEVSVNNLAQTEALSEAESDALENTEEQEDTEGQAKLNKEASDSEL